jgi:hypothetical protein
MTDTGGKSNRGCKHWNTEPKQSAIHVKRLDKIASLRSVIWRHPVNGHFVPLLSPLPWLASLRRIKEYTLMRPTQRNTRPHNNWASHLTRCLHWNNEDIHDPPILKLPKLVPSSKRSHEHVAIKTSFLSRNIRCICLTCRLYKCSLHPRAQCHIPSVSSNNNICYQLLYWCKNLLHTIPMWNSVYCFKQQQPAVLFNGCEVETKQQVLTASTSGFQELRINSLRTEFLLNNTLKLFVPHSKHIRSP